MIDERYIELMNQEIDGENTPAESDELHRFLDSSAEGKHYFDELRGVRDLLEQAGTIDSPAGMKWAILSKLEPRSERRIKTAFIDAIRERFRPKYAYAFAVGLIAGICLYAVFNGYSRDGSRLERDGLYGTIALDSAGRKAAETLPVEIDMEGVTGTALFSYFEKAIVAEFNMRSDRNVELQFELAEGCSFESFKTLVSADNDLRTGHGTLRITSKGVGDFLIVFRKTAESPGRMRLKLLSGEELLLEKTIDPGRK